MDSEYLGTLRLFATGVEPSPFESGIKPSQAVPFNVQPRSRWRRRRQCMRGSARDTKSRDILKISPTARAPDFVPMRQMGLTNIPPNPHWQEKQRNMLSKHVSPSNLSTLKKSSQLKLTCRCSCNRIAGIVEFAAATENLSSVDRIPMQCLLCTQSLGNGCMSVKVGGHWVATCKRSFSRHGVGL